MPSINRILIPTDFSECSKPAMALGCSLATDLGAEVHLLNVVPDPAVFTVDPTALPADAIHDMLLARVEEAEATLEKLPESGWSNGKPVTRATRQGIARDQIVTYAKENDIDLIVVGTHGRTGFRRLMLGSIAEGVLRLAECPVLTVRSSE